MYFSHSNKLLRKIKGKELAIISFIKRILGIYKPTIILQARDARINPQEVQEIAELIRARLSEYKVVIADSPEQRGKGITLNEILYIWIIPASIFFGKKVGEEIAKIAVEWAKNRLKKKGSKFPTSVPIYGANGKIVKSVTVKHDTQEIEVQTKADKWKRKPPSIKG